VTERIAGQLYAAVNSITANLEDIRRLLIATISRERVSGIRRTKG